MEMLTHAACKEDEEQNSCKVVDILKVDEFNSHDCEEEKEMLHLQLDLSLGRSNSIMNSEATLVRSIANLTRDNSFAASFMLPCQEQEDEQLVMDGIIPHDSSIISTNSHSKKPTEQGGFSCRFCSRRFYSSQALGGHQNAHKIERSAEKEAERYNVSAGYIAADLQRFRPSTDHGISIFSDYNHHQSGISRSCLGIKAHSLIHKKLSGCFSSSLVDSRAGIASHGWSPAFMSQQPAVSKCFTNPFQHEFTKTSFGPSCVAKFDSASFPAVFPREEAKNSIFPSWKPQVDHQQHIINTRDSFNLHCEVESVDLTLSL